MSLRDDHRAYDSTLTDRHMTRYKFMYLLMIGLYRYFNKTTQRFTDYWAIYHFVSSLNWFAECDNSLHYISKWCPEGVTTTVKQYVRVQSVLPDGLAKYF